VASRDPLLWETSLTKKHLIFIAAVLSLAACGKKSPPPKAEIAPVRTFDAALVERGRIAYQKNCASCHGDHAQGAPDWHKPDANGKWPPPPLNGTGHAWHHPRAALERTIRDGTIVLGGNMPAWGDKLTRQDIDAIIAWFQQKWPDELYAAWWRMDRQSAAGGQ
jgi:mono/diheme cytochrome c family protein